MRIVIALLIALCLRADNVDLILKNGRIVTLDKSRPEARSVAIRDGRIVALGSDTEVSKHTAARTIDLKGALAIPGFIEGHGHLMGLGLAKMNLDLRGARNWNEIVAMVRAAAKEKKPGEWIRGRGFHQSKWDSPPVPNVQGFPLATELNKAAPNNPVWLTHASGHAAMVNEAAMKLAGIGPNTKSPPGGEILKDASGQPTGLLNETAQSLVGRAYSSYEKKLSLAEREAEARKQVELATNECVSKGITSFQDAGSGADEVRLFKAMAEAHELPLRLWVMLHMSTSETLSSAAQLRMIGFGGDRLTVRAIKRYIDGALGSRGAWMLAPYADLPSTSGFNTEDLGELRKVAEFAIANGFQFCIHAIGDRGNREILNLYESVFREHSGAKYVRWRIEHAQHISAADIPRFGQLGVIASMQAIHCTSDAPFVVARLGAKRAEEGAYVWRKLIDSGAIVVNGTDVPVEDVDPIANYYAAVTRKLRDGSVFYGAQKMTREEALRSCTSNGAYAAFEENIKGTLTVGKLGDITVLSKDILKIADDEIPSARVLYTIVGGKVAYESH